MRASVTWAYHTFFKVIREAENDILIPKELKTLDFSCKLFLKGYNALSREAYDSGVARWPLKPKHHSLWHVNDDCQSDHRTPKAKWAFGDEDMMGKMSLIACAVHAVTLSFRTLERWCMNFFSVLKSSDFE